jgi:uncharacterized protein with HEPN domain
MTQRDDTAALRHMLDYAQTARRLVEGRTREDLDTDEMLRLALTRAVEVIGEAAKRVSSARREAYPGIPWAGIVSARNRLIHGYDLVDLDILWDIVTLDLPPLVAELERILADRDGGVQ